MLANIGSTEIIIIAVIILILFGGKKLPEMGKGLGESLKEFKNAFGSKETKK
ncbi:MAG: Sec-independent protein translocase protein TatA [Candidatus Woesebacteria bacterium GW2011_GWA1_40_45]|uniref:Sec-independent protein translocase protein TatA n=1 Tax=Candidatus Woesebacteria bacterium GW2011_GWA1_40_45 TaxID=1618554 RepID=A0A0G0SL32_9BACT|nr:MAG: Sec-independent protein translocase protein TatA [Candidatus Woesebacteria bacterium GW2011_GWA1_40_45]